MTCPLYFTQVVEVTSSCMTSSHFLRGFYGFCGRFCVRQLTGGYPKNHRTPFLPLCRHKLPHIYGSAHAGDQKGNVQCLVHQKLLEGRALLHRTETDPSLAHPCKPPFPLKGDWDVTYPPHFGIRTVIGWWLRFWIFHTVIL